MGRARAKTMYALSSVVARDLPLAHFPPAAFKLDSADIDVVVATAA